MPQEAGGYQSFGFLFRNPQKTWWKGGIFAPPKQVFFDRIASKFLYVASVKRVKLLLCQFLKILDTNFKVIAEKLRKSFGFIC